MRVKVKYVAAILCFSLVPLTSVQAMAGNITPMQPDAIINMDSPSLNSNQWDHFNKQTLNKLLFKYSQQPSHTNYAVFDFDNTTAFLDIEEATLIYQLQNLKFALTPDELNNVLHHGIPQNNFNSEFNNQNNEPVNIDKISQDIIADYTWLYANYCGLHGSQNLNMIKQSDHYKSFITKMRYLYAAIGGTFNESVSYPWVTYLFKGMDTEQVGELGYGTIAWQSTQPIGEVTWISPQSLPGKTGVVSITWNNGFKIVPEMKELYQKLRKAGVDVYIVSASNYDLVKSIATNPLYGLNVEPSHVYAIHLSYDKYGKLIDQINPDYPLTQGAGKTETIKKFIAPNYQGKGPILVGGDSEGDQNMMTDFSNTENVLIINRVRSGKHLIGQLSKKAVDNYGKNNEKFLLQGRDDRVGQFIPSQIHYAIGATLGQKLHD